MKKVIGISAFLIAIVAFSANAQTRTPRATARQGAQRTRIHEGRESGEVTNGEAAVLNAQQRHIRRTRHRAKADGTVTPAERAHIQNEQNRASRTIHRARHNDIKQD